MRRKPGLLERYVELLYRRKVRAMLVIMRLRKHLTGAEFNALVDEEHKSTLVRSVTFFFLGIAFAYLVLRILLAVGVARADEPPKKRAFMIGDSQAFLLMSDMPRLAPAGWEIKGAVAPGSSIISWSRGDHRD